LTREEREVHRRGASRARSRGSVGAPRHPGSSRERLQRWEIGPSGRCVGSTIGTCGALTVPRAPDAEAGAAATPRERCRTREALVRQALPARSQPGSLRQRGEQGGGLYGEPGDELPPMVEVRGGGGVLRVRSGCGAGGASRAQGSARRRARCSGAARRDLPPRLSPHGAGRALYRGAEDVRSHARDAQTAELSWCEGPATRLVRGSGSRRVRELGARGVRRVHRRGFARWVGYGRRGAGGARTETGGGAASSDNRRRPARWRRESSGAAHLFFFLC